MQTHQGSSNRILEKIIMSVMSSGLNLLFILQLFKTNENFQILCIMELFCSTLHFYAAYCFYSTEIKISSKFSTNFLKL